MRRTARFAAVTAALVVLPTSAAWAHPGFSPEAIPAGQPVETTLNVAHGCAPGGGDPDAGEELPTTRFDLATPDRVHIEPAEVDGWEVTDQGDAIVWTAEPGSEGGGEPAPSFPLTITVSHGQAGETLHLDAHQACTSGDTNERFRWVAGPDEEGDPAVRLELTSTASPSPSSAATTGQATEPATDGATDTATDGATDDAATDESDGGGTNLALVGAAILVGMLVLTGLVTAIRRKKASE